MWLRPAPSGSRAVALYIMLIGFAALAARGVTEWLVAQAAPDQPSVSEMTNDYTELSGPDVMTVLTPSRLAAEVEQQHGINLTRRLTFGQRMGGRCVFSYTGRAVGPDDPNTYVGRSLAYSDERCVQLVAEWVLSASAALPLQLSPAPVGVGPTPTVIEASLEAPHAPPPPLGPPDEW